jgi:hypothetical protein
MGRIDIKGSEDKTLERRYIDLMLRYKDAYELVKKAIAVIANERSVQSH